MRSKSMGVALAGLLLAAALILSYVEASLPFFFGVPGMKLGLPNLAVVLLLYLPPDRTAGGARAALTVNVLRILIAGFLYGSLFGILFSAAGALASLLVMNAVKRTGHFGIMGVSISGGLSHNLAQLLVACLIAGLPGMGYYAPVLIIAGTVTGAFIGVAAGAVLPYMNRLFGNGRNET